MNSSILRMLFINIKEMPNCLNKIAFSHSPKMCLWCQLYLVESIMTKHEEVRFFHCLNLDPHHPFPFPYILGHTWSNRHPHVHVRGIKGQQSTHRNLAQTSHSATTFSGLGSSQSSIPGVPPTVSACSDNSVLLASYNDNVTQVQRRTPCSQSQEFC